MNCSRIITSIKPSVAACIINRSTCVQHMTWYRSAFSLSSKKSDSKEGNEDFFAKNERLKRPVSPHLTIYKPQVTSIMSLAHRATGIYLAGGVSAFSIAMIALPGSYPYYLSLIEASHFGSSIIFLTKFGLAFPFIFHLFNGLRHLAWDLGYGFNLRDLYKSGYFVMGTSLALAAIAASL